MHTAASKQAIRRIVGTVVLSALGSLMVIAAWATTTIPQALLHTSTPLVQAEWGALIDQNPKNEQLASEITSAIETIRKTYELAQQYQKIMALRKFLMPYQEKGWTVKGVVLEMIRVHREDRSVMTPRFGGTRLAIDETTGERFLVKPLGREAWRFTGEPVVIPNDRVLKTQFPSVKEILEQERIDSFPGLSIRHQFQ